MFKYPGVQRLPVSFECDSLLDYDVILTTYPILSKEFHYAQPPPERSMRSQKVYQSRRSPLMEFSWWRVCLDEAQMVEGSVTGAAIVACMISRVVLTPLRVLANTFKERMVCLRHPMQERCVRSLWPPCLSSVSPSSE